MNWPTAWGPEPPKDWPRYYVRRNIMRDDVSAQVRVVGHENNREVIVINAGWCIDVPPHMTRRAGFVAWLTSRRIEPFDPNNQQHANAYGLEAERLAKR